MKTSLGFFICNCFLIHLAPYVFNWNFLILDNFIINLVENNEVQYFYLVDLHDLSQLKENDKQASCDISILMNNTNHLLDSTVPKYVPIQIFISEGSSEVRIYLSLNINTQNQFYDSAKVLETVLASIENPLNHLL